MDYKAIQELIKAVNDSNLTTVEIESEGVKLKLEKRQEFVTMERIPEVIKTIPHEEQIPVISETPKIQEAVKAEPIKKEGILVSSPIVGTFYASPSPDSESYVTVGSKVKKGQVLCIIEAMKLMNEIESEVDGEIIEVLAEKEQMVEYGQPLFRILEAR
ncbi:acetyl-CoA carboxylase biotin carboxyl carrier protein [Candidatus Clostridium radicumherbarum]|uniref:Biotin carboxyl carrier protein of acetyl-CoA carboxylase n=1 Tax=Candidatus Clostridium radicumherbarum TaxID=3381662 RepID=A0ABW8TXS7_9CLOT